MYKINVQLRESEIIGVITYLTIRYKETEKKLLDIQKNITKENDPKWKENIQELKKDFISELNELTELINVFKFAK